MTDVFLYGTLCHPPLFSCVSGQDMQAVAARLPGHQAMATGLGAMLVPGSGDDVAGVLVRGLDEAAQARLFHYHACLGYVPRRVELVTEAGRVVATAFQPEAPALAGDWNFPAWLAADSALALATAAEIMARHGQRDPGQIRPRIMMLRNRAQARLQAGGDRPAALRRPTGTGDVEILARRFAYENFYAVEEYDLRHRRFDGAMSAPINRAAFVTADVATVLPYDRVRDRVLLIEQFRIGPVARGDGQAWSLEVIAGLVDAGETPHDAARREAREEAGLEVGRLHRIHGYYPSPGANAEYMYSFLAEADLPESAAGLGGVLSEGEDIRAHVLPFDAIAPLMDSGEIENAPLVISLMWLARHRERLRQAA
ncbi:nudix-type nucleoside diphosphatase (YffH/AdpP family) [Rhodovulum imhoffii]|uniref:ADP-ribose pyrophosphatase n=1 Tax=Rhodovulum imhoffii TaxID=365340 RepID=A0A2T5BVH4_9RHOB|nr:NUDIX domain-containing protein [Rhodovulum imhoffii]MBK5932849.1 hypothetical protein [Rhodovulum imhoffii]PTN03581.1 nudix-type nucleoside diphosphatase (YffH/AdpP family) [Rhodovulum imhoffii]